MRHHRSIALAAVTAGAAMLAVSAFISAPGNILAGFDAGVIAFLVSTLRRSGLHSPDGMPLPALLENEGRRTLLVIAISVTTVVMLALGAELQAGHVKSAPRALLSGVSIILAWLFINTLFANHYAHRYYLKMHGNQRTLNFPNTDTPTYADFLYFSFVLGMTFQVADVAIESTSMRKLAVLHGIIAFFFNIFVLAITVNIIAAII